LVSSGYTSDGENNVPNITLNGASGQIIANSIELGNNATIKDKIKLGKNG
jgi:hypothetical protein